MSNVVCRGGGRRMNHVRVVPVLSAAVFLASCQTIVEELPASGVLPSSAPVPIVVITMPQVQPTNPPVAGSGGGGGGSVPPSSSQPQPTSPPSQPSNGCWRNNCNPVASVHAQVYYIQCQGQPVPDTKDATSGPSDCDVVLDATPKDAAGRATNSGMPNWNF